MVTSLSAASSLLSLLLLSLLLLSASAQKTAVAQIVFTEGKTPKGWRRFKKKRISDGVKFITSKIKTLEPEFASVAFKKGGFSYEQRVPAGRYSVVLGFAELKNKFCQKGKRIFIVEINGKASKKTDVFKKAGCAASFTRTIKGVVVGEDRKLIITLKKVKGPPILANFAVFPKGRVDPPTPSPSATSNPMISMEPMETTSSSPTPSSSPSVVKPPKGEKVVWDIDSGGLTDNAPAVFGPKTVFPNILPIDGTDMDARFSKHRFALDFGYELDVQPNVVYTVKLFFAEVFLTNCQAGKRLFDIFVFDGGLDMNAGKKASNVDVFVEAGCRTPYTRVFKKIAIGDSGKLKIQLVSSVENAMISALQVTTKDAAFVPTPTPEPPVGTDMSAMRDAGNDAFIPGTGKSTTTEAVMASGGATEAQLQTARFGSDWQYEFSLAVGDYEVTLSFSENFANFCTEPNKRVFDVAINGVVVIDDLDIFAEVGCYKGLDFTFPATVAADTEPLTIRFTSSKNFAQVNYVSVANV